MIKLLRCKSRLNVTDFIFVEYFRSSSRPDLITITPIYDDADSVECSSKAVLTTVFREKRRSTAFVLAKDLATGEILRSDVILDVIDKLDVLTTTRELYLEEAPETFKIWAQDSQGKIIIFQNEYIEKKIQFFFIL